MLTRRIEAAPLELLDREFGRMLGRLWGHGETPAALAPYAVDVHEDGDHFYVEAELPGFTKEDVEVTLEDGVLTIRAEKKGEMPGPEQNRNRNEKQALHVERRWNRFERSFTLPTAVKEDAVRATLENGVLRLTLDKREEVKPRKIQIDVGAGNGNGAK